MDETDRSTGPVVPPNAQMYQLLSHFALLQAMSVVTRLGVPETMAGGPRPVAEIADEVGAHAPTLHRVLRVLAEIGIFTVQDAGYGLTPLGDTLRRGAPGSLASLAVMAGSDWMLDLRGGLYDTVRTGRVNTVGVLGTGLFEYLQARPEAAEVFDSAMTNVSAGAAALATRYDFGRFKTLVDIGGGRGYLLASILAAYPGLSGVLFDQAHVLAGAGPQLERVGVADRCELVAGDFFESVPAGADGYLINNVLHDWPDETVVGILRVIAAAMTPDATLLISGWLLPDDATPYPVGRALDLQMLLVTDGGRERNERDYRELLGQAGLELQRVVQGEPVLPAFLEVVRR
jgi:hypothetical protein